LLQEVKQALQDADAVSRTKGAAATESFGNALTERILNAREHNQLVADERYQLMERIAAELKEMETNFEARLSQLAQSCQTRLSSVCVDAELAIVQAHDNCAAQFKALSSQQQKSIDDKTQELLQKIELLSQQAIHNIKAAAGDNGAAPGGQSGSQAAPTSADLQISDGNPFGDFGDLKL
jgi:hypothetical protein